MVYRKIYEEHHGEIPKGYHIHHIDGNHSNNCVTNLQCVSAQEHYNIHYSQGDYGACWSLINTGHLTITNEKRSELGRLQQNKLVQEGIHPWQTRKDGTSLSLDNSNIIKENVGNIQRKLVKEGKHNFLSLNRSPEMEIKRSKTLKKKYKEPIFKEKMRQNKIGRTWELSPENAKKVSKNLIPLNSKDVALLFKGTVWVNNGIKNKRIKNTEQIPEGYTKGRLFVPWNKRSNI